MNYADRSRRTAIPFLFHVCLCYAVLSVPCSLVVTCLEWADLLALLCVVFPCAIATVPYGVPGQVWYLIVSIPDLCLPLYFQYDYRDHTCFFIH